MSLKIKIQELPTSTMFSSNSSVVSQDSADDVLLSNCVKQIEWTRDEHNLFLQGIRVFGKDFPAVASLVKTKNIDETQTYGERYFKKISKMSVMGGKKRPAAAMEKSKPPKITNIASIFEVNDIQARPAVGLRNIRVQANPTMDVLNKTVSTNSESQFTTTTKQLSKFTPWASSTTAITEPRITPGSVTPTKISHPVTENTAAYGSMSSQAPAYTRAPLPFPFPYSFDAAPPEVQTNIQFLLDQASQYFSLAAQHALTYGGAANRMHEGWVEEAPQQQGVEEILSPPVEVPPPVPLTKAEELKQEYRKLKHLLRDQEPGVCLYALDSGLAKADHTGKMLKLSASACARLDRKALKSKVLSTRMMKESMAAAVSFTAAVVAAAEDHPAGHQQVVLSGGQTGGVQRLAQDTLRAAEMLSSLGSGASSFMFSTDQM